MRRARGSLLSPFQLVLAWTCLALATWVTAATCDAQANDPDVMIVPGRPFHGRLARDDRTSRRADASRVATPDRATGLDGAWVGVPPPARVDHTAIYDPVRNRMVIVSGYPDDPARGAWVLWLSGVPRWEQVPVTGTPPPEIYGGAGAYDSARDRILLWDSYQAPSSLEKVYALSLSTMTWSEVATSGSPPPYRTNETMIYDPVRDRLIVFAGWDYEHVYQDVWSLSLSGTPTWAPLVPSGAPPPARFAHVAIYDPVRDRMVAFGGYAAPNPDGIHLSIADTWELTLGGAGTWTQLAPSGIAPFAPSGAAAAYNPVRDRLLVYGGGFNNGNGLGFSRALYALSFSPGPAWQRIIATAPAGPPPFTQGHSAIYDPGGDRLVTFGGLDEADYYAGPIPDAWAVTMGSSPSWSRFTPATASAAGRIDRTAIYDSARRLMVLFGGGENVGDYCCQAVDITTWAYDLQFATWQGLDTKATRPSARMDYAAIYDPIRDRMILSDGGASTQATPLDLRGLSFSGAGGWSVLGPTGTPPPGRSAFSTIYDPARDRMIVFGGESVSPYVARNDVWSLRLSDLRWEQILPSGALPSPRHGHMAIYDPTGDRMIVFGGAGYGPPDYLQAWALSLGGSPAWTALGAPSPAPDYVTSRQIGAYDPLRQRMIVVGGLLGPGFQAATWALNLMGPPSWSCLDVGPSPAGEDQSVIYDPLNDRLLVPDSKSSQLFALQFPPGGPTPTLVSLVSAETVLGRTRIIWQVPAGAGQTASVSRRTAESAWQIVGHAVADAAGRIIFEDSEVVPGTRYGYRVGLEGEGAAGAAGEVWVDVPAAPRLALRGAVPNPASRGLRIEFSLAGDSRARLEVIDIAGRRVASREVGALGAGAHAIALDEAGTLHPGLYLVRLTQGGESRTARALLVP